MFIESAPQPASARFGRADSDVSLFGASTVRLSEPRPQDQIGRRCSRLRSMLRARFGPSHQGRLDQCPLEKPSDEFHEMLQSLESVAA
jgi:hypothetical protein